MSTIQRILTGLEFIVDPPTGCVSWPPETEEIIRLSMELARLTHSGLAFAAVASSPEDGCECDSVDRWLADAEEQLEQWTQTGLLEGMPLEVGAWLGEPSSEWAQSAFDSSMDLLIVPCGSATRTPERLGKDIEIPRRARCPVWFTGREPNTLEATPPLIAILDDLREASFSRLLFAVELAFGWNARLLVVHPVSHAAVPLPREAEEEIRRQAFCRLSRTDFRSLAHGSQLRILDGSGGLQQILDQLGAEQVPNLVMAGTRLAADRRPVWKGHLCLWPDDLEGMDVVGDTEPAASS